MTSKPEATTVLIVDDESAFSNALREVLQHGGLSVSVASDGVEALRSLEESPSAVVITDLNMPQMGGAELIREASRLEAQRLDVARYFTKPVKLDELKTVVRDLLTERNAG